MSDILLTNARVWTGDPDNPHAQSVLIRGDRIAVAGTECETTAAASRSARVIDLGGRFVTPGLIDNHVHFTTGGFQLSRVNLRSSDTVDDFSQRIAKYAASLPEGAWVLGGEWDHERWPGSALPARHDVDAAAGGRPVFVTRLDMHMALVSSEALRFAGIDSATPDPPGGTIVRNERGELTGIVKDTAMELVRRCIPSPSLDERIEATRAAMREAARQGVTAVCDMSLATSSPYEDFRAYQTLDREGGLTTRISLYLPLMSWQRLRDAGVERDFGSASLRIGGLKGFSDGSLGSSTAWMSEPYSDGCGCGFPMPELEDGSMERAVEGAVSAGLQVAIHAIGDRANSAVLDLLGKHSRKGPGRARIEHAQHLSSDLVARFGASGVTASMQPAHAIDDGRWADRKIGDRSRWAYPFRSLLDAGAVVTFGSDWPVATLSPLTGICAAVTRRTGLPEHEQGWIPEERIDVEEALRCYTTRNAWAMHREDDLGRIAPGFLADLTVFSRNLMEIPPEEIDQVAVEMTMAGGQVVYEGP